MLPVDTRHTGKEKFINTALCHIPTNERKTLDCNTKIVTMHNRFGYCLKAKKEANIIVINDAVFDVIFQNEKLTNDEPFYRWLIYTVLHEVAHAYLGHDGAQSAENEEKAEVQAINWYNGYAPEKYSLPRMEPSEIRKTEMEIKRLLKWEESQ